MKTAVGIKYAKVSQSRYDKERTVTLRAQLDPEKVSLLTFK